MRQVYVSYEEARTLKPLFSDMRRSAPWTDARQSASRILQSLESVKSDVEYEPGGSYQMILSEVDYNFLLNVMDQTGLR